MQLQVLVLSECPLYILIVLIMPPACSLAACLLPVGPLALS